MFLRVFFIITKYHLNTIIDLIWSILLRINVRSGLSKPTHIIITIPTITRMVASKTNSKNEVGKQYLYKRKLGIINKTNDNNDGLNISFKKELI